MRLTVQLDLSDEIIAADTGDKLMGRRGMIERRLCELLAQELYKSCTVRYERAADAYDLKHRVRATVVVGKEVEYAIAPPPRSPFIKDFT